jgi:hypothetical protein
MKRVFNCRGCDVGGDVIKLVEHLDGIDFTAACTKLAGEPPPANGHANGNGKTAGILVATYEYLNAEGELEFAVDRIEQFDGVAKKKTFRQKRPDPEREGRWIYNVEGVCPIPYRLFDLVGAIAAEQTIFIVEGEKCADTLMEIGVPATTNSGGAGKWKDELNEHFKGADVVLVPDHDDAGWRHINAIGAALTGIAKRIRVLVLPGLRPKGDVADWFTTGGTRERFDDLAAAASEWKKPDASADKAKPESGEQRLLDDLAALPPLDYDRRRATAAEELGVRAGTLDNAVEARRAEQKEQAQAPPLFGHWVVEPWGEAVDTDALLLMISRRLRRHIVFSDDQATAVALWVLLTWVHADAVVHSPILMVTSPEGNCGKTTLLDLIKFLTPNSLITVGVTGASLFRSVELWTPTLIVDEADATFVDNDDLRAVINSGWTRGAGVIRCVGDDQVPQLFSTFCPKAIGLVGKRLPSTTQSRAVAIELKRKLPGETCEDFDNIDDADLADLRGRARRWSLDNIDAIKGATPSAPPGFENRLKQNWRTQFAIADLAGGEWPERAREAARRLSKVALDADSIGQRVLADIKAIFDGGEPERISSADTCTKLALNPDSPWAEWKGGKSITQPQLARLLKPFGISPEVIRMVSGGTIRGYQRSQFEEAWERYLPPVADPSFQEGGVEA